MRTEGLQQAAGWWDGLLRGELWALGLLVIPLFVAVLAILVSSFLRYRRRHRQEVRRLVAALEQLRASEPPAVTVAPDSVLSHAFDAVERLSQDLERRTAGSRRGQSELRAILDAVYDSAVVSTDADGDVTAFSEGAIQLFGWSTDEILGKPWSTLFESNSYKDLLPKLGRRSAREQGVRVRAVLTRKTGDTFHGEILLRQLRGEAESAGMVLIARDVTTQVRMERELRESEERARGLVEALAEGVLIVRGGAILFANPAFAAFAGRSDRALAGTPLRDRVSMRDVLQVEERLAAIESGDRTEDTLRFRLLGADDRPGFDVAVEARSVEYDGERAVLVVMRDETLEKRIEAELRRNETQLDSVLEATNDGILVLVSPPEGGRVQMVNRALLRLLDRRQDELLGLSRAQMIELLREAGEPASTMAELLQSAGEGPTRRPVSLRGERRRELEVSTASLKDRHGNTLGRVLVCRDLTEHHESKLVLQRQAEQLQLKKVMLEHAYRKLDGSKRDLQTRTERLDRLNDELRTLDEMKTHLLSNVSHELQTPLVSIRGYTEMILKGRLGPVTEEQRKGLQLALNNIDRLISMIDNLLTFTRGEDREVGDLELSRFSLGGLVDEAAVLLEDRMLARQVRYERDPDAKQRMVNGDRNRILQVFINLLSNAVKFSRPGGKVTVSVRDGKPGFVHVEVIDQGVGIPARDLDHVFDRAFQVAREGAPESEGSGLGLAIVQEILRLHGTEIAVESEEGKGSRFHFSLPLAASQEQEEADDAGATAPVVGPAAGATDRPEPPIVEAAPPPAEERAVEIEPTEPEEPSGQPRFRIIRPRDS